MGAFSGWIRQYPRFSDEVRQESRQIFK